MVPQRLEIQAVPEARKGSLNCSVLLEQITEAMGASLHNEDVSELTSM